MTLSGKKTQTNKSKRTRLNADDRRQQLIDIALNITAKKGLCNAKHADIAEEAKIAVSTVFFYFPKVEDLNNAIIDAVEVCFDVTLRVDELFKDKPNTTIMDLLRSPSSNLQELFDADSQLYIIFLEWANAIKSPMWERYLDFRKKHLNFIETLIRSAEDKKILNDNLNVQDATIVVSTIFMATFRLKCFGDSEGAIIELNKYLDNYLFK